MTLASRTAAVRTLRCDHLGCATTFSGTSGEHAARVRGHAREAGWACWNSGPGISAHDLCPVHREEQR